MDVRERLKKLIDKGQLCPADRDPFGDDCENCQYFSSNNCFLDRLADHLISNGVTITPAVPGPEMADANIMELCFHNGERHMKEKVGKELTKIAEHMPCITLAQALAILEGL